MSASPPPTTAPDAGEPAEPLVLRPSRELALPPSPHAAPRHRPPPAPVQPPPDDSYAEHLARALSESPTWVLVALAGLASAGWIVERRRRRELETDKDSVLWADVQAPGSSIITDLVEEFRDEQTAAVPQGAGPPTTTAASRREATLIDLHALDRRLRHRRARGDLLAAAVLLQQHLADFRFTSPWVFLELREVQHLLGREQEWELAREAFRARFAQRAPVWRAPSTAHVQLADDPLICDELVAQWPYREARMIVRRWLLGDPEQTARQQPVPILALGVYRDLLFLDRLLDRVMESRTAPQDSLL